MVPLGSELKSYEIKLFWTVSEIILINWCPWILSLHVCGKVMRFCFWHRKKLIKLYEMQIFGRFLDWRYGSGLTSWPRYSKLCFKKHEQTSHEHKICRKCCLIQIISLPNCSVSKVTIGFSETVLRSVMGTQSAFNNPEIPCAKALVSLFSQIIVECTCEINAAEGHNEGKKRKKLG